MNKQLNIQQANNIPLLFAFAKPQEIQECKTDMILPSYNPYTQTIEIDCRVVGTRSLRTHSTKVPGTKSSTRVDKKNDIDDSKSVK
jgi:hypothetical protein